MSPQANSEVPSSQCKKGNTASCIVAIIKKRNYSSSEKANLKQVLNSKKNLSLKENIIQYSEQCPQQPSGEKSNKFYMTVPHKSLRNITLKCNSALAGVAQWIECQTVNQRVTI